MNFNPSKEELEQRILNLFSSLDKAEQRFDTAIIISKVNQYYFTGTMQNGILLLKRDEKVFYFTKKSYERAKQECPLDIVYMMASYKDMLDMIPSDLGSTFIETEIMPIATLNRLKKYFTIDEIHPIDGLVLSLRAVKSEYEIEIIKESARQHKYLYETIIPQILKEGMSETDFAAELFSEMLKLGHHGVSRFSMFQMEMVIGQIGFGENSIYPTNFDGPGGMKGMHPAVPIFGSRDRFLKKGDLVFVDLGFGINGYHSDKTQIYSFGVNPSNMVSEIHNACKDILKKAQKLLKVGSLPSEIYMKATENLPACLSKHFMGYKESVKFLGHGVGLHIDEMPVIAKGINNPLKENMVIALEPKCGIEGIGTVGVEETYVIKNSGAVCLTGGAKEIIVV